MGCVHPGCTDVFQGITGTSKTYYPLKKEEKFSIFPNPAKDWVLVSLSEHSKFSVSTITLTDLTGHIIIQKNWPTGQNQYLLCTASLPSGAYLLALKNQQNISVKKLLIQK
jgi:hypothetical protein